MASRNAVVLKKVFCLHNNWLYYTKIKITYLFIDPLLCRLGLTVPAVRYDSCWNIHFCQLLPLVSSPYRNFVLLLLFYWCRDFSQLHRFSIKFQPCKSLPSPVGVMGRVSHILGPYPREKSRIIVQKIGVVVTSPVAKSRRTILLPYYLGYKAMAIYPIQGHPRPYNGYKAMAL